MADEKLRSGESTGAFRGANRFYFAPDADVCRRSRQPARGIAAMATDSRACATRRAAGTLLPRLGSVSAECRRDRSTRHVTEGCSACLPIKNSAETSRFSSVLDKKRPQLSKQCLAPWTTVILESFHEVMQRICRHSLGRILHVLAEKALYPF